MKNESKFKDALDLRQSRILMQRGINPDKASGCAFLAGENNGQIGYWLPVFTLADLFALLPKVLHKEGLKYHYVLTVYWDEDIKVWRAIYDAIGDNIAGDCAASELIDALYMLMLEVLKLKKKRNENN